MHEVWKTSSEFPDYDVSTFGRIRANRTRRGVSSGTVLKPWRINTGYQVVRLRLDGAYHNRLVHRLIAETFLNGATQQRNEVNHRDGNKANNHASNLEWVSDRENKAHAWSTGLSKRKITRPIRDAVCAATGLNKDIANRFGLSESYVWKIRQGVVLANL